MDRLHFERRELKYFVPEDRTEELRRFIQPYVRVDDHAAGLPGNRYTIHNCYLETPRLDWYHQCEEGASSRIKLRVRWYDDAARGPFFLEVKRKVRGVVIKDRALATREEALEVLAGGIPPAASTMDRGDWRTFIDRVTVTGAAPYIRVQYTREPYESVFGEYARVTFDREIRYQVVDGAPLDETPRSWNYVDGDWATKSIRQAAILELKTTADEAPRWMSDLVTHFGLVQTGYSKYANSVAHRLSSSTRLRDVGRVSGWAS